MPSPLCRIVSIGKVTAWGKEFLEGLRKEELVDLKVYPDTKYFLESENEGFPQIVFLENVPESRHWIVELRESHVHLYIILFGKTFTKEDLSFAVRHRVFRVLENFEFDSYETLEQIKQIAEAAEKEKRFELLIVSLKKVLEEAEGDIANSVMSEFKTALEKIGRNSGFNEFSGEDEPHTDASKSQALPAAETLFDVLQMIDGLERTGVLWVKGETQREQGEIHFLQGRIVAATSGSVTGLKAIYRMFLWERPQFAFSRRSSDEMQITNPINVRAHWVGAEGLRHRNQYNRLRSLIPPPTIVLELDPRYLHPGTSLPPNEFTTLASVVEFGKVSQILDYTPLPDAILFESLINLRKLNIIRTVA